jgi:hypothetical protein
MIVVIEKTDKKLAKAFIKDRTFHLVDDKNKKQNQLPTNMISKVLSIHTGKVTFHPADEWTKLAMENDFWGAN